MSCDNLNRTHYNEETLTDTFSIAFEELESFISLVEFLVDRSRYNMGPHGLDGFLPAADAMVKHIRREISEAINAVEKHVGIIELQRAKASHPTAVLNSVVGAYIRK